MWSLSTLRTPLLPPVHHPISNDALVLAFGEKKTEFCIVNNKTRLHGIYTDACVIGRHFYITKYENLVNKWRPQNVKNPQKSVLRIPPGYSFPQHCMSYVSSPLTCLECLLRVFVLMRFSVLCSRSLPPCPLCRGKSASATGPKCDNIS